MSVDRRTTTDRWAAATAVALALAIGAAGCGSDGGPSTLEVNGTAATSGRSSTSVAAVPTTEPVDLEPFFDVYRDAKRHTDLPVLVPLESWRDRGLAYLVVGEIVRATPGRRWYSDPQPLVCEIDEGVPTPDPDDTCEDEGRDNLTVVFRLEVDESVAWASGQQAPAPGSEVDLVLDVATAKRSEDHPELLTPLVETAPVGSTVVALVVVDGRGHHLSFGPTMWAIVQDGSLEVPRDPENGYRLYGTTEFGRLRIIRTLVQSGYSLMAILRMLRRFDAGKTDDLRTALDVADDEGEEIQSVADRWLSTLLDLEGRSQAIIRQIGLLIELAHAR